MSDERKPRTGRPLTHTTSREEPQPGDELIGQWPKLELEQMDHAFRQALAAAAKRGQ
jgi:hypothetical protein